MVVISRIAFTKSNQIMSQIPKTYQVFVYGTLKRNQPNHYWLTDTNNGKAKFLGEGQTINKFPLVIGTRYNIPFLLNKIGIGNNIEGEVYEIDDKMFGQLDILEDYPQYYDREIQKIQKGKDVIDCWLYLIRKFPESMLKKEFLKCYSNTKEKPYCESYLESASSDLFEDSKHSVNAVTNKIST